MRVFRFILASFAVMVTASISKTDRGVFVDFGEMTIDAVSYVGGLVLFIGRTIGWLFRRVPRSDQLLPTFYEVGVKSLPVVAITGTFIGMVLALQTYYQFRTMGLESRLGAVINMTLVRELGPVLAATMLAGRVGSAMAAQLGTMRVTEQIDALSSMGASPMQHLVVPRFLACVILIPALTVVADFMGVMGGYLYSVAGFGIDRHFYWYNSATFVGSWDFFSGILKSFFFGATIAIISCYRGFHCKPGAEGVGQAATAAFVHSFVLILVLDFLLNVTMDSLYYIIWPSRAAFV